MYDTNRQVRNKFAVGLLRADSSGCQVEYLVACLVLGRRRTRTTFLPSSYARQRSQYSSVPRFSNAIELMKRGRICSEDHVLESSVELLAIVHGTM